MTRVLLMVVALMAACNSYADSYSKVGPIKNFTVGLGFARVQLADNTGTFESCSTETWYYLDLSSTAAGIKGKCTPHFWRQRRAVRTCNYKALDASAPIRRSRMSTRATPHSWSAELRQDPVAARSEGRGSAARTQDWHAAGLREASYDLLGRLAARLNGAELPRAQQLSRAARMSSQP